MIIGFTGKQGSGKDFVAFLIGEELEKRNLGVYYKYAYADNLKQFIFNIWGTYSNTQEEKKIEVETTNVLGKEKNKTVRTLLQEVGQAIRKVDQNAWIKALVNIIKENMPNSGIALITDVRYQNEADICDIVIRVQRKSSSNELKGNEKLHLSETEQDGIKVDFTINNNTDNETPWMDELIDYIVESKRQNQEEKNVIDEKYKDCSVTRL